MFTIDKVLGSIIKQVQHILGDPKSQELYEILRKERELAAPTTHFVKMAQAILYRGAGLDVVWPQFLAIIAIGATFFAIALSRFRKTIGAMA